MAKVFARVPLQPPSYHWRRRRPVPDNPSLRIGPEWSDDSFIDPGWHQPYSVRRRRRRRLTRPTEMTKVRTVTENIFLRKCFPNYFHRTTTLWLNFTGEEGEKPAIHFSSSVPPKRRCRRVTGSSRRRHSLELWRWRIFVRFLAPLLEKDASKIIPEKARGLTNWNSRGRELSKTKAEFINLLLCTAVNSSRTVDECLLCVGFRSCFRGLLPDAGGL